MRSQPEKSAFDFTVGQRVEMTKFGREKIFAGKTSVNDGRATKNKSTTGTVVGHSRNERKIRVRRDGHVATTDLPYNWRFWTAIKEESSEEKTSDENSGEEEASESNENVS